MITNEEHFMAVNALENICSVIDTLVGIGCLTEDEEKQFNEAEDILCKFINKTNPDPNPIPRLPKEKWVKAFATLARVAMGKGYFDDILRFDLYFNHYDPPAHMTDEEADQHYDNIWARVIEGFKEVFGYDICDIDY